MIFYFLISQPKHVGYQTTCFGTKDIAHNCMFRPKKKNRCVYGLPTDPVL